MPIRAKASRSISSINEFHDSAWRVWPSHFLLIEQKTGMCPTAVIALEGDSTPKTGLANTCKTPTNSNIYWIPWMLLLSTKVLFETFLRSSCSCGLIKDLSIIYQEISVISSWDHKETIIWGLAIFSRYVMFLYLLYPGVPGVRSMGPDVRHSVSQSKRFCRLNWCDSGWWG